MFPFELSLFGTGLMMIVTVLVVLYLVVLIKLNPSTEGEKISKKDVSKQRILEKPPTEGEKISKKDVSKQRILEKPPTERQVKTAMLNKIEEETPEPIERQEPVSPAPVETKKTAGRAKTGVQGCPYRFGYLAEHPKNTPIPNECLTCTKIMECLLGRE